MSTRYPTRRGEDEDTDAIATFDEHLSLFHCPLFTSLFLGGRRACETADLAATLVGRGGQTGVIAKLESGTSRSEAGVARETRRCLGPEEEG
jgi:hypothetical protein